MKNKNTNNLFFLVSYLCYKKFVFTVDVRKQEGREQKSIGSARKLKGRN